MKKDIFDVIVPQYCIFYILYSISFHIVIFAFQESGLKQVNQAQKNLLTVLPVSPGKPGGPTGPLSP